MDRERQIVRASIVNVLGNVLLSIALPRELCRRRRARGARSCQAHRGRERACSGSARSLRRSRDAQREVRRGRGFRREGPGSATRRPREGLLGGIPRMALRDPRPPARRGLGGVSAFVLYRQSLNNCETRAKQRSYHSCEKSKSARIGKRRAENLPLATASTAGRRSLDTSDNWKEKE